MVPRVGKKEAKNITCDMRQAIDMDANSWFPALFWSSGVEFMETRL